jgi:predicted ATPase
MLRQIEIENYRSCRHVVLDDLGPLTVLVGRNAVGKTNVLRGIQWMAGNATATPSVSQSGDPATRVSCQAVLGEKAYHYSLGRQVIPLREPQPRFEFQVFESLRITGDNGHQSSVFERRSESVTISENGEEKAIMIGAFAPCMPALVSLLPAGSPTTALILPFLRYLERIRYYPLAAESGTQEGSLVRQVDYEGWIAQHPDGVDDSVLMRLLHMAMTSQEQLAEVRSLLGPNGLGLLEQFHHFESEGTIVSEGDTKRGRVTEARDRIHILTFRPTPQSRNGPQFFDFDDLAAGTKRLIRIVVSLIYDGAAVMLLEHPEDDIHRALLRKLIDVLQHYSDQTQLIIASHSPIVFNTLDPGAIRLVTMEEDGTKVRALTTEELHVAGRFLEEDGSLSDFIDTVEES